LLALRESYFFCRNSLGLWFHPFKTVRVIYRQKDISQGLLILGIPLYLFLTGFVFIKGSRFLIGAPSTPWGPLARLLGVLLLLLTFFLTTYLFYWFWKVLKIGNKQKWQYEKHEI